MPRLFTTYEEAWSHFEGVQEMESFADQYPEGDAYLITWYIPVAAETVPGIIELQGTLTAIDGMVPIPPERLHVSVAPASVTEQPDPELEADLLHHARQAWADTPPFPIELACVNGFPTAVVAEVHGPGPARLLDRLLESGYWRGLPWRAPNRDIFLPHLTVAISTRRRPADEVREVVKAHRHDHFADLTVDTIELCRVPVARSRLLQPWEVVGRITLNAT
ncbi:MAG TPA: 2'-5' RNA ligase family protein [Acidimicrobiales bacterium]|nr:2'-5' RNA ligase family protein [Acidimicrobiales bacterium]